MEVYNEGQTSTLVLFDFRYPETAESFESLYAAFGHERYDYHDLGEHHAILNIKAGVVVPR